MPGPSSSTRRLRHKNIENVAMKLLTFFYTLLNKEEKTELKKEIKDIGKKSIGEIVNIMNNLIGNIRETKIGGAASIIGASSNSIIKFVLLLVCLLYINTRVGASIEPPKLEKLELINTKGDKKSLSLDHSQVWKEAMSVMGTSTDVKRIYTEINNLIKEKWTVLQEYYPGEATVFEPYYKLYEADGCVISESASAIAPYRFGLLAKDVIPKVYNQFIVLKDAGVLSNDDYEKLGQIATSYILGLPPDKLTNKIVCDMQRHTMISLMAQQVSNRLAKETQAGIAAEPKFTEPTSKAEVNGMFKQIIDYFKGSEFIIVLLGIFGLGYSMLNRKKVKSKTANDKKNIEPVNKQLIFVNGIEMLKAYNSSSSDEKNVPVQAPVQAHNRTDITADVTSQAAQDLGLPTEFGTTKGRSASRSKNRKPKQ
jgi:hypothetical protein